MWIVVFDSQIRSFEEELGNCVHEYINTLDSFTQQLIAITSIIY